jgi:hypothetical protein
MGDMLQFTADIDLQAADGQKRPRVTMIAYSGGIFSPSGYPNCIIDLAGAQVDGNIPLLDGHDQELDSFVGQGTATIRNGQLLLEGILTDATNAGQKVLVLAKSGVNLQASVGYAPGEIERIHPGESVQVNGRKFTARNSGLTIIRSGRLREVSLLPLGADSNTQVSIAASAAQKKGLTMSEQTTTIDSADVSAQRLNDARLIEARISKFHRDYPDAVELQAGLVSNVLAGAQTLEEAKHEILYAENCQLELRAKMAKLPQAPAVYGSRQAEKSPELLQAALLCHMGHESAAVKLCGEQTTEQARGFHLNSLHDILRAALQQSGRDIPASRHEMIKAAFSTNSVVGILSDAANKVSLEAYRAVPSVARVVAKKLTANDFKAHTGYRLTGDANFQELGAAGEIKHGKLGEQSYTYRVSTFARMFGLTREDVINDDLGKFDEIPRLIGRGSAMKLEQLFWTLVLANTGNFFSAGNKNYISGAGSALSIGGLGAAVTALRQLTDTNGDPIAITPKFLACPPELESTADALYASTNIVYGGDTSVPDSNPYKGKYQPQVSPYLSNSNYEGHSADAWFLFGDPGDVPAFGIAYLDGVESPTIESGETDFNTLGVQFRGYHDFGVCQIDPNGGVMAAGK